MDMSEEAQTKIMEDYGEIICDKCKNKLRINMKPIKKRLDEGKTPHIRHLIRLQKSICQPCNKKIINKKNKNQRLTE